MVLLGCLLDIKGGAVGVSVGSITNIKGGSAGVSGYKGWFCWGVCWGVTILGAPRVRGTAPYFRVEALGRGFRVDRF